MSQSEHVNATAGRRTFLRATAGAATAALAAGLAAPVVAQAFGDWFDDVPNYDGTVTDRTGESAVTVETGVETANGPYGFGPPAMRIDPGTTVTFSWVSDAHNVLPEEQPEGAGWEGHEPLENTGFEYEHTFETEGVYLYYCRPHLPLGMKGAIVVGDVDVGVGDGGEDEDEGGFGLTPGVTMVGAAIALAILSPIAFGLFLLRKRRGRAADGGARAAGVGEAGGTDETVRRSGSGAHPVTPVAEPPDPVREIDHEEFDPVGTASLVVAYLAILVVMWLFMYFVEFLGRGPTVIG